MLKPCHKKQVNLNRKAAKYAKFNPLSRGIVQNRVTVLDKAAFSFAACPVECAAYSTGATRQMKNSPTLVILPWRPLSLERSGRFNEHQHDLRVYPAYINN
jgi:hypothetical protein